MVKHNNVVCNIHRPKHDEDYKRIKVNFAQPAKKLARRQARKAKNNQAALRPLVRCVTRRYNTKLRVGRGFSLEEVKAAGLSVKAAKEAGVAVDHRRACRSEEAKARNVARLQAFLKSNELPVVEKNVAKVVSL
eukprot:TRINITY_DN415_c0_g2_i1.p1 TRINITY_DN415_c0_g2~~TRINITY_DN415_c0_g2_i1.p1  ORF type:complete len:142 (-),score=25.36 TRINITY_DN415_c0_g2_i1:76-477(-)